MEFSYDVDGGGREYHHVHDFDIDYKSVGTDFLPFDGLFLSLQHSKERFVAAFLMTNQRDVVAIITRSNSPAVLPHDKKYFVHLNFSSTSGGGGLYLSACENTTFTVRVILAERAGTNFFLMLDGSNYQREYVPIEFANKTPFYSYVHWSGAQQASVACVKNGRLFTPALLTWVPQQHGPPNLLQKTSGGGGGCGEMTGGANRKRDRASPPPPETTAPHVAAAAAAVEEYDPSRPELDSEASMSVAEEAQRMQNLINTPFLPLFEKLGVRRVQRRTVEDNDAAAEYEPVMEQHPTTTTVYSSRR